MAEKNHEVNILFPEWDSAPVDHSDKTVLTGNLFLYKNKHNLIVRGDQNIGQFCSLNSLNNLTNTVWALQDKTGQDRMILKYLSLNYIK